MGQSVLTLGSQAAYPAVCGIQQEAIKKCEVSMYLYILALSRLISDTKKVLSFVSTDLLIFNLYI